MNAQVLRCLPVRYASILDQAHSLKLELPCKLPSLHDPPPAPSKHLTRCLRNRVQASSVGVWPEDFLISMALYMGARANRASSIGVLSPIASALGGDIEEFFRRRQGR